MTNAFFKTFIISLLLCSLFWITACAPGPGPTGSGYISSPSPPEERDPEFWTLWESMHGGGG